MNKAYKMVTTENGQFIEVRTKVKIVKFTVFNKNTKEVFTESFRFLFDRCTEDTETQKAQYRDFGYKVIDVEKETVIEKKYFDVSIVMGAYHEYLRICGNYEIEPMRAETLLNVKDGE